MGFRNEIEAVASVLARAETILFITGAGISADSGLPTYRGIGGLYNTQNTEDDIPIEMALAGETLTRNPALTWKYLLQIESRSRTASYNRAHRVVALFQKTCTRICVLTQNIDGFHQKAGSRNVIDIHGDMHDLLCLSCRGRLRVDSYEGFDIPPRCTDCGGILRPGVVFFGEMLPGTKVRALERELARGFDAVVSVGTTSTFPYIRAPVVAAANRGTPTIEINPSDTCISSTVDIRIKSTAASALDAIWQAYRRHVLLKGES